MRLLIWCLLLQGIGLSLAHARQMPPLSASIRPMSFLKDYAHHAEKIAGKLRHKSQQALAKMYDTEKRIAKKLLKKDSVAGKALARQIEQRYQQYRRLLSDSSATDPLRRYYLPVLDSVAVALRLLQVVGLSPSQQHLAAQFQSNFGGLQEGITRSNLLQQALSERVRELRAQLAEFPGLKELGKISQTVSYYKATIAEYRLLVNDPDRMLSKMLRLLSETAVFKRLFERYSMLTSLLPPTPANLVDPLQTGGLQVRNAVMTGISQAGNNTNLLQTLQQEVGRTPNPWLAIKDKVKALQKDRHLDDPADVQVPNQQRTKSLWQRIEIGSNVQTTRSSTYFPVTSDLGLSIGFRINDKSSVGIGGAYRLGWGKDFRHLQLSHQGVGLRTFINAKIKGSFAATGGYELNYQEPFAGLQAIPDMRTWRKSGLVGITKTVDLKSKLLKKTQVQLLLDLLSFNTAYPPILVRVGYQFTK
ncbi:hypothetical protein [Paraflavitalea pollutisoli]|uniref:hypothetical protein n=1 Tax=Paraflavitalea pollutisoli TaxID=3034143 RepID=UPI0023EC751E|nr:hypothetical protein [Paraflavitalea sp. H1-2-19X]